MDDPVNTPPVDVPKIPPMDIVTGICRKMSVAVSAIRGPGRTSWLVKARREIAVALDEQGMGLTDIGRYMNRDHSSIHHLLGRKKRTTKKKGRKRA